MNYIDRAIESSTRYLYITNKSDPASLGIQRENAAIAITGIFGVTCKTVIQRHLELSREAVINCKSTQKETNRGYTSYFCNQDRSFIVLTNQGIREAEFLLNRELHLRSDVSRVNERNLLHDLGTDCYSRLSKDKKIRVCVERDIAIQLENRANDRLVDALVVDANTAVVSRLRWKHLMPRINLMVTFAPKYLQIFTEF